MRKEYDLSNLRPNKYAKKYAKGSNVVIMNRTRSNFFRIRNVNTNHNT